MYCLTSGNSGTKSFQGICLEVRNAQAEAREPLGPFAPHFGQTPFSEIAKVGQPVIAVELAKDENSIVQQKLLVT